MIKDPAPEGIVFLVKTRALNVTRHHGTTTCLDTSRLCRGEKPAGGLLKVIGIWQQRVKYAADAKESLVEEPKTALSERPHSYRCRLGPVPGVRHMRRYNESQAGCCCYCLFKDLSIC